MTLLHALSLPGNRLLKIVFQHPQFRVVSNRDIVQQLRQIVGIWGGRHLQAAGREL